MGRATKILLGARNENFSRKARLTLLGARQGIFVRGVQRALLVVAERARIFVGARGAEIFGTRGEKILERAAESFASAQRNFFYERATNA